MMQMLLMHTKKPSKLKLDSKAHIFLRFSDCKFPETEQQQYFWYFSGLRWRIEKETAYLKNCSDTTRDGAGQGSTSFGWRQKMKMVECWIQRMNLQQESKPDPYTYCAKSLVPDSSFGFDKHSRVLQLKVYDIDPNQKARSKIDLIKS